MDRRVGKQLKAAAIIVAAGRGTRMGGSVDKVFLEVAGAPMVVHTWRCFEQIAAIGHIVLVVRSGMEETFRGFAQEYGFMKPYTIAIGGAERQDSVWNGLCAVPEECGIVAIQDGARPCTPISAIEQALEMADEHGASVLAQRVTDTIKVSTDGVVIEKTLDRSVLWAVQTPQVFRTEVIKRAISTAMANGKKWTDDTAACEAIGQKVYLVPCSEANPKATCPGDLPYIDMILKARGNC